MCWSPETIDSSQRKGGDNPLAHEEVGILNVGAHVFKYKDGEGLCIDIQNLSK